MEWDNRVILVTGAGSGIGKSCIELLLAHGATVIGFDITESGVHTTGYHHMLVDVRDEQQIIQSLERVQQAHPVIYGLVNCAGIISSRKPFFDIRLEDWNNLIAINLTGTFLMSKYVTRMMMKHNAGKIVNIGCIRSRIFKPDMAEYSASKGGIAALTSAMALDAAPYNIQINSVAPGLTYTGITEKTFLAAGVEDRFKSVIPMGRIADPSDIAKVGAFPVIRCGRLHNW